MIMMFLCIYICGNGRDSIFFNKLGLKVFAVDQCNHEIEFLKTNYPDISWFVADFTKLEVSTKYDNIYSRFTLHSINSDEELKVIKWVNNSLKVGGRFFIEVRSINDPLFGQGSKMNGNTYATDHSRRFVNYQDILNSLSKYFKIEYSLESTGLAPYNTEDPVVIRIVCIKEN